MQYTFAADAIRKSQRVLSLRAFSTSCLRSAAVTGLFSAERTSIMSSHTQKWQYPEVRRDDSVVDNYHGTSIADPYRSLEDPDAKETQEFVEAQNDLSVPYINGSSVKETYLKSLTDAYNYPKTGCPYRRGDSFYHYHNTGLQNQSVLYSYKELTDEPKVFLDPNTFSEDGTVALGSTAFSKNGKLVAYGLSSSGSDWQTIKVRDADTSAELSDVLEHIKFSSIAWTHDNKGFFYCRYPVGDKSDGTETDANLNQMLYYHIVGTAQSDDVLCWKCPEQPKWMCSAEVTDDGEYVILGIVESCDPVNRLYYCKLSDLPNGITGCTDMLPCVKLIDNFDAKYDYIANDGREFSFMTNLKSPRYKLIRINLDKPEQENWADVVAEHEKDVLSWCSCVNQDKLVVCYQQDVKDVLYLHKLSDGSRIKQFPLDVGSVVSYSGRREDNFMFYKFTSFLTPGTIYYCDLSLETLEPKVHLDTKVAGFEADTFEVKQVFYESYDRTRVPMFIIHQKGISLDGNHPVLMYGYGGFNISLNPSFSVSRLLFCQHLGGVLAIPNLRGGGEYGETWHKGGIHAKKQNVFDDFHSAAEYLIANKYTNPKRLAIQGGSNGGLLVGACINQKPYLYGCGVAQVGVMDMLRFHKFTIGHAWCSDYGCSDSEEDFHWLVRYSPLHTIKKPLIPGVQFPSMLLFTGDHDDRVVPLHSLKYIATLQHELAGHPDQTNPLMIRVHCKQGHGAGKPTEKVLEESAEMYSFIARSLGVEWRD
ncbi:prolyl endopeptidase-like [Sycon ciliatum]|uniref:prolyl endopeptidase-like n=1 Tax=Sycon ciliatum TaxID=27933 RepID=UPI0031F6DBFA